MTPQDFGKRVASLMADASKAGLSLRDIREQLIAGAACASIAIEQAPVLPGPINRVTLAGILAVMKAAQKEARS